MANYPISNVARRIVYTGSAGVGPYAFSFEILEAGDVDVYKNDTLLTLTTNYTVTINANGTGSVTLGVAAISTDRITIVGSRAIERTTDFVTGGDLFANTLNEEIDSQTIFVQQVAETAERSIKAPVTDPTNINMTLPSQLSRAGKTLAFDANGNPVVGEDIGNWRGDWTTSTSYGVRDLVKDPVNMNIYRVNTAHVSSGSAPISSNADSAKWDLVLDASSAQLAADWAKKTNGIVDSTDYSSKAWSIGGTGVTNTASRGAAKEWATKTGGTVDGTEYSAKKYAQDASASASAASTSASNASTSATNASNSASSASTSATNASNSATAAATSATNSANSATASSGSATSAANSAALAAASAASGLYSSVIDKSANYTVVLGDAGALIRVTTTSGAITITLPAISTVTDGFKVAIVKWTGDSNGVSIVRSGSDTINGATSSAIGSQYTSTTFVADFESNQWLAVTSGLGSTNVAVDSFNGNGSTVAFTLSGDAGSENNTQVFISGVYQEKDTYSLSGTTLTFSAAPPTGTSNIEVVWTAPLSIGVPSDGTVSTAKIADSNVTYAKIQNVTAAKVLGRNTSGSGVVQELPIAVDSNGNVGIGTTSPANNLQVISAQDWGIALKLSNNTASTRAALLTQRSLGTAASPTAVTNNTIIGGFEAGGYNGSAYTLGFNGGAGIFAFAAETWTTGSNATYLQFLTNPSGSAGTLERMRIDQNGYLLVGVSDRTTYGGGANTFVSGGGVNTLTVANNSASDPYGIYVYYSGIDKNNTTNNFLQCAGTTTVRASIRSNGGLANYSANNVNLSDRREKINFAPAGNYLSKICAIPIQTFNYVDQNLEEDDGLTLGVVAQDVQAIAPELVIETDWGTKDEPKMRLSIYQTDLQYALMKCIQELKAELDVCKAEIAALKGAK